MRGNKSGKRKSYVKDTNNMDDASKTIPCERRILARYYRGTGEKNPNSYCDFYLGDETENKKTRSKEVLVSFSDCGCCWRPHQPFLRTPAVGVPPSNRNPGPLVDWCPLHSTSRCPTSTVAVYKSVTCSCVFS